MSGATARGATASTSRKPGLDGDTLYFPFSSYFHRKQAVIEFREAELKYTGNGLRIDKSRSGKHRSVYRCPSVIIPHPDGAKGSGKTQWLAETLPGFVEPSIQSGESRTVFCRRRLRELEAHAEARGLCPFKVILKADLVLRDLWQFQKLRNGEFVIHHAIGCTSVAKLSCAGTRAAITADVQVNPGISKGIAQKLTGPQGHHQQQLQHRLLSVL